MDQKRRNVVVNALKAVGDAFVTMRHPLKNRRTAVYWRLLAHVRAAAGVREWLDLAALEARQWHGRCYRWAAEVASGQLPSNAPLAFEIQAHVDEDRASLVKAKMQLRGNKARLWAAFLLAALEDALCLRVKGERVAIVDVEIFPGCVEVTGEYASLPPVPGEYHPDRPLYRTFTFKPHARRAEFAPHMDAELVRTRNGQVSTWATTAPIVLAEEGLAAPASVPSLKELVLAHLASVLDKKTGAPRGNKREPSECWGNRVCDFLKRHFLHLPTLDNEEEENDDDSCIITGSKPPRHVLLDLTGLDD